MGKQGKLWGEVWECGREQGTVHRSCGVRCKRVAGNKRQPIAGTRDSPSQLWGEVWECGREQGTAHRSCDRVALDSLACWDCTCANAGSCGVWVQPEEDLKLWGVRAIGGRPEAVGCACHRRKT
eukprot:358352-Chlamydomonas_euryale.AAC.8